ARKSRRDVFFIHLWEDPQRYRGVPIHHQGAALQVFPIDVDPKIAPGGRVFVTYVITPDSRPYPYILHFVEAPKTLPGGANLSETVAFDAFFLKIMAYHSADQKIRYAPLLVGRLTHLPHLETEAGGTSGRLSLWLVVPLAVLFLYTLVRVAFALRRMMSSRPAPRPRGPVPTDEIAPEDLNAWLEGQQDRDDEEPEDRAGA
ncbi:MAG: hypothetical protein IRY99_12830, partial [Isosphaeraceae bacterium]|nr:hypothetical protein [Isosphaeraceae bacterium]